MQTYLHNPIYLALTWVLAGFVIGIALGVNTASMWLVAAGLGGHLLFLRWKGPARWPTETPLALAGPGFMMAWVLGFVVHGLIF